MLGTRLPDFMSQLQMSLAAAKMSPFYNVRTLLAEAAVIALTELTLKLLEGVDVSATFLA
jgi:hypothetical protein